MDTLMSTQRRALCNCLCLAEGVFGIFQMVAVSFERQ